MAFSSIVRTYFEGTWHDGDVAIIKGADHGAWLGTSVFDGARFFEGVTPDLWAHCDRVNRSAEALMMAPTLTADEMVSIAHEGLSTFARDAAVYIRPMYWAVDPGGFSILPSEDQTAFAMVLEEIPMAPADATMTLCMTRFRRPVLESSVVNAKAGCLYPNNMRMLAEARQRGFGNTLVQDAMGNVAETATSNVFMVRDGEVLTPIANGTFLAGITRSRTMTNLRAAGYQVTEAVLSLDDFHSADEVFMTGNMTKVTPVTAFEDTSFQIGPVARAARETYWDWALSAAS